MKPIATVKVAANEANAPVINSVSVTTPHFEANGGETKINIKGVNLDNASFDIKVVKMQGETEIETEIAKDVEIFGTDKVKGFFLTFPPSSGSVDTYSVSVGLKGETPHKVEVTVGGTASGEVMTIYPSKAYVNNSGDTITLSFDEEIFAVKDEQALKQGISLDIDGDGEFIPLNDDDEVKIEGNKIIISLKTSVEVGHASKIAFKERLFKDRRNMENMKFDFFIKKFMPIVNGAEFIEGEVLKNAGGKVALKLIGENLNVKDDKGKYLVLSKVEKLQKINDDVSTINPTLEYVSDGEVIISFELPENKTKITQSYAIRVSLDGGHKYSAEVAANIYENRSKRLVSSVLPKGVDETKPTLSFMSIQSYGTSGGNAAAPDITHTNLPTGQESKKTWVYVYGTNLKKDVTKVKIVDELGIEWYPIENEGTSDSMDNFIMVGFDGTGVSGNGNNQMLEIICPRNIKGDRTYRYLVAVDGKNYNQEIYVTATVLDDNEPGKLEMSEKTLREVTVEHVDEAGKIISESYTVKGYEWSKVKSFGVKLRAIEGYEVIGVKTDVNTELANIVQLEEQKIADIKKFIFVYKKITKPAPKPLPKDNQDKYKAKDVIFEAKTAKNPITEYNAPAINGYLTGYSDGTFRPDAPVTRAEACAMIVRLFNLENKTVLASKFVDVKDEWYTKYINAALSAELIEGYGNGNFLPNKFMTRAEFASIVAKLDKDNNTSALFADMAGHWASFAVGKLFANGRISGYPDNTFKPDNAVSRIEAITILNKVAELTSIDEATRSIRFNDMNEKHWGYEQVLKALSVKK